MLMNSASGYVYMQYITKIKLYFDFETFYLPVQSKIDMYR
jgi:hypothetical protein